ncbi:metallophosphatase family protein [Blastopirellula sp. JC732]|uniref:Metallophosphatase family protein n=1 Tax=Blastopirellula sediminis TaxID=2894196 RepID=A0A9X1MSR8_9BACT|nr:metallophosphoesterase family protein [Blastopirellula sediminis]MCC9604886.1 metallophosphatase family protein [Blastopirellula sediminis]MCC9631815.1 metallophosphatase family protein [Blastopirellula sediminis]
MTTRIACFGGVYNNYLALDAAIADAKSRGVDQMFCLGDLGAFGPHPDRVFPLLHEHQIQVVCGNYDDSIGRGLNDCQCGYTDPRDNYFAQISYDYTLQNTSTDNRAYLRTLPAEIRLEIEGRKILLCHGSPRRTNEFLWESTTSTSFLDWLSEDQQADLILATHTGIHWGRELANRRAFVNVGVLGRPANDGQTEVWYTIISVDSHAAISWQFVPLAYDFRRLSREMASERLPAEFIETIETGWWTTCLEVLPAKERRSGLY